MQLIRKRAFARAGLVGNPSDGYHGKTISLIVRNFCAEVVLYEWDDVELLLRQEDRSKFGSVLELVKDVELHGYYGGVRLIKATIKRFVEYCVAAGQPLHDRNFTVRYQSNIPRQVGLAGSSALIVATLRCLMEFYDVTIPLSVQPSLALSVERDELGIAAGLQDRVIQVYEGLVYMDFSRSKEHAEQGFAAYEYEPLDPELLPTLYVAYSEKVSEPTERSHGGLRERYNQGDPEVLAAITRWAGFAEHARSAILSRDHQKLGELMDQNFDLRAKVLKKIPTGQLLMVQRARAVGASAKFAGSGGAIIGIYQGDEMFNSLCAELHAIDCRVIRPQILMGNNSV